MLNSDYYRVLGVAENASAEQIKEAYRKSAYRHHPDRNPGDPQAAEKMKGINEAYAVLSNPNKRREYDMLRNRFGDNAHSHFRQTYSEQDIFRGSDIHRVFEEMAQAFGVRGVDEVFREFYGQGYRSFEFKQPGFFAKGFVFTGSGRKNIPRTDRPATGGTLGKLARLFLKNVSGVEIPVNGADLRDRISISPELAKNGGPYAYFLRQRSKKLVVKIPAGMRQGQQIRLAGMGGSGKAGGQAGDLYLDVRIREPYLERFKKLLKRLTGPAVPRK